MKHGTMKNAGWKQFWLRLLYLGICIKAIIVVQFFINRKPEFTLDRTRNFHIDHLYDHVNKKAQIIDRKGVTFKLIPTVTCGPGSVVIFALSAPKNTLKRKLRREDHSNNSRNTCLIFLLGRVNNKLDQENLEKEHKEFGDILQNSVEESYNTLSYKTLGGFIWINKFSPDVKYIVKIDDDVRIDHGLLVHKLDFKHPGQPEPDFIECPSVMRNMKPWRHNHTHTVMGKWSVSRSEMPRRVFPDFCNGWIYVTTPKVALYLAQIAIEIVEEVRGVIRLDDIFVTGFLRERIPSIKLEQLDGGTSGYMWDNYLSTCPFLGITKNIYWNDVVEAKGSGSITYIKGWKFYLCAFLEYFILENLERLLPNTVPEHYWDICSR